MSNKAKRVRKQQRAKTTRKAPFKVKRTFKDAIQLSDEQYQKMYRKEGRVEGESMIQRLIKAMKDARKAVEDIFNEISDSAKLPGLYKQYGITA
ncbi:MAG: hypothetical protein IJ228_00325 [Succinivibrio sp.]|nr:hypothetical protein [Succinivibrio sp.]